MTTPNTTDNKLFNLCKEVYKRFPEWEDAYLYAIDKKDDVWEKDAAWLYSGNYVPLYTSDYLLEKLPDHIYLQHNWDDKWRASQLQPTELRTDHNAYQSINSSADTPLKALLKLVIALDDAGVKL